MQVKVYLPHVCAYHVIYAKKDALATIEIRILIKQDLRFFKEEMHVALLTMPKKFKRDSNPTDNKQLNIPYIPYK